MADRLASENVIVQSPMSFTGATKRIWRASQTGPSWLRWCIIAPLALVVMVGAWCVIACWYSVFGLLLAPFRLLRRGSRNRKRQALQHREMLDTANRR